MLQTIREHTQGWIAGIIITIIILTFALWGIHSYFVGGPDNRIIAEVNGVEISKEQLSVAFERMRRQAQDPNHSTLSQQAESALKEQALRGLIEIEILKQAALAQNFQISNRQVDNYLQTIPDFQVDGQFSVERFHALLSSSMFSTSEFLDLIKTSLLIDQPKLGIVYSSFATANETQYTLNLVNQERNFDYLQIPVQYFLSQPMAISAKEINTYYNQHKNDYMTPEQVNVDYIELSLKDIAAKYTPTETMLRNAYNENTSLYMQPMSWKLRDIEIVVPDNSAPESQAKKQALAEKTMQAIKEGNDFNALAKKYSSTLSGETWLTLEQIPAELRATVSKVDQPNTLLGPIKTAKGFVLLKVVEVKAPAVLNFEAAKDKVRENYIRQHAEEKFANLREQLADLTYEHPDSLETASTTLNLPIKTSELFSKEKVGKDIAQYKKVRSVAFSNEVLNLQNNSDVLQINPETLVVLRLKSHINAALIPLPEVSKQIEDKLKIKKAEVQAEQLATAVKTKLQAGLDPLSLVPANQLHWQNSGYLGRYSNKVDTALLDMAFRMPIPKAVPQSTFGMAKLPNGYAVIALKGVKEGTIEKQQGAVFAEQVQNSQGLLEYELYKQSQIKVAKIKMG